MQLGSSLSSPSGGICAHVLLFSNTNSTARIHLAWFANPTNTRGLATSTPACFWQLLKQRAQWESHNWVKGWLNTCWVAQNKNGLDSCIEVKCAIYFLSAIIFFFSVPFLILLTCVDSCKFCSFCLIGGGSVSNINIHLAQRCYVAGKILRTQMGPQGMKVEIKGHEKMYWDDCIELGGITFIHSELHSIIGSS